MCSRNSWFAPAMTHVNQSGGSTKWWICLAQSICIAYGCENVSVEWLIHANHENQIKCTNIALDIYNTISYWIFLLVSAHKGPSSGNLTKVRQHKTRLVTFVHGWPGVKQPKYKQADIVYFLITWLYKNDWFGFMQHYFDLIPWRRNLTDWNM